MGLKSFSFPDFEEATAKVPHKTEFESFEECVVEAKRVARILFHEHGIRPITIDYFNNGRHATRANFRFKPGKGRPAGRPTGRPPLKFTLPADTDHCTLDDLAAYSGMKTLSLYAESMAKRFLREREFRYDYVRRCWVKEPKLNFAVPGESFTMWKLLDFNDVPFNTTTWPFLNRVCIWLHRNGYEQDRETGMWVENKA